VVARDRVRHLVRTHDTGVVTIGGPDFGILGEGYLRLSYANSTENILKALDRMGNFLATRKAA
jgi:aspartate aminotransferase